MKPQSFKRLTVITSLLACATFAHAADWSDNSIGYRTGTKYAEPFNTNDISKDIVNLTHASGYKYGGNFINVDMLMSSDKDPSSAGAKSGAHEVYVVYRHTLDLGKMAGTSYAFGPVRGVGITAGFDYNTKTDAGYNSKKRMLVAGPVLMMDVPGFLNIGLLALHESNAPYSTFTHVATPRYTYDMHAMLTAAWGIPFSIGSVPFSFEGFANFIDSKGKNEFGGKTAAETNIDMQVMYDMSGVTGAKKGTFKIGFEYQYWKNKFGNDASGAAGKGAFAKTPMVRIEYHM
jgi:nucleoside-specific outer membrane channel protein Tsx